MVKRNAETGREVLKRIVALLFALAELADRASLASRSVRYQMLAILHLAEAVAQTLVIGKARDFGLPTPLQTSLGGDGSDDMTRLALSLRILALALASLAERSVGHGSCHITVAQIEVLQKFGQLAACHILLSPDTS